MSLVDVFYAESNKLGQFVSVDSAPAPFDELLDHNAHMTVTVERYHRQPVDVAVHRTRHIDHQDVSHASEGLTLEQLQAVDTRHYVREITLAGQQSKRVVQYGIVRLNVGALEPAVWREIEQQQTPLGRVLIEHDVLRDVSLCQLWRVTAGRALATLLNIEVGETVFGRTAMIRCDGNPAIELLEIVVS